MAKSLDINLDGTQDKSCEEALTSKVKDLSLFYGTLQNLLYAKEIDSVLDIVQNGFKIIFNIPRMFYFLFDEKKSILTGFCNNNEQ